MHFRLLYASGMGDPSSLRLRHIVQATLDITRQDFVQRTLRLVHVFACPNCFNNLGSQSALVWIGNRRSQGVEVLQRFVRVVPVSTEKCCCNLLARPASSAADDLASEAS